MTNYTAINMWTSHPNVKLCVCYNRLQAASSLHHLSFLKELKLITLKPFLLGHSQRVHRGCDETQRGESERKSVHEPLGAGV